MKYWRRHNALLLTAIALLAMCLRAPDGAAQAGPAATLSNLNWLYPAAATRLDADGSLARAAAAWTAEGPPPTMPAADWLNDDARTSASGAWLLAYLDWELAFLRGDLDAPWPRGLDKPPWLYDPSIREPRDPASARAEVARWHDWLALRWGNATRAAGAIVPLRREARASYENNEAWIALAALALLDAGDPDAAAGVLAEIAAAAPRCPDRCVIAGQLALARGTLAFFQARRDRALEQARVALAALTAAQDRNRVLSVPVLADLGLLFVALSAGEDAATARRLARERAQAELPASHPYTVLLDAGEFSVLANEGETALAAELLAAMQARHGEALHRYRPARFLIATGQGALGFMRADYEAGMAAAERARAEASNKLGPKAPAIAEALNIVALNESSLDRNDDAIAHYREALAVRDGAYAAHHPLIAELTNNLSVVFHNIGRYDLAEAFIRRTLTIDRAFYGEDNEEVASDLSNLAAIHRTMGDPQGAIAMLRQAVDINTRVLGKRNRRTAIMYHSLGQAYLESGEPQAAFDSFATSIEIHGAIDQNSRNIPIARHNLAKAAIELGRFELARDTIGQVLIRYREIYGPHHRHLAAAYRELSEAQLGLGDVYAADDSLVASAGIAASADAPEIHWRVFMALARQEERLAQPEAAIFFGKLALDVLQNLRASQTTLKRGLQRAFARQRSDSYRHVAGWLVDAGRLVEAQRIVEMLKDEEYFDFTRRQRFDTVATVPYSGFEAGLRDRLNFARDAARTAETRGPAIDRYRDELGAVRAAFAGLRPPDARDDEFVVDRPPAGAANLYFVVGDTSTRVIVSTATLRRSAQIDVGRRELARRVLAFRTALNARDPDIESSARAFYDLLIGPLEATLVQAGARTLWLQLDDSLRYLPFAALHDGRRYLGVRYALVSASSAVAAASDAPRRVAAFALTRPVAGFASLPAAGSEVERIVRRDADDADGVFPGRVWLDEHFSAPALREALAGDFGMLHIASHFEFAPGNEKDSFLLLGDGERLSLYDFRTGDYPLTGVSLLTMSGCSTALSAPDADGREIDGFAMTAARRGAANVLATLWPVDDAVTADFMGRFYGRHAAGDNFAEALRHTRAALTDRHPFFWAPFILWSAPEFPQVIPAD